MPGTPIPIPHRNVVRILGDISQVGFINQSDRHCTNCGQKYCVVIKGETY